MILAKTFKGYGVSFLQDKEGWHGKALKAGDEMNRAIAELEKTVNDVPADAIDEAARRRNPRPPAATPAPKRRAARCARPTSRATWWPAARRTARRWRASGKADQRVVALDADVGNSTFSERFEKVAPDRFFESYIAEQVMVGAAMGLAARGAIPFPSTFACFLTRAYDFLRMAAISNLNIKLAGSHAGVSIGEDGPSQMALEDLAMTRAEPNFTVLYPSDAVCAERCVELAAYQPGPGVHPDQPSEDADPLRRERDVHGRRLQGAASVGTRRGRPSSAPASRCSRRSRPSTCSRRKAWRFA